jgi:site-specific recombinase XerD
MNEAKARPEVKDFLEFLSKERQDSVNTVIAYGRDLMAFQEFCDDYFGGSGWDWSTLDRLAIRSFMGELIDS